MGFLENILKRFQKRKNKTFRESVEEEKSQKYLIKDRIEPIHKKGGFFKKENARLSPFSRFIQEKIEVTQDFSARQGIYLKTI
jgi:hypothetical protein